MWARLMLLVICIYVAIVVTMTIAEGIPLYYGLCQAQESVDEFRRKYPDVTDEQLMKSISTASQIIDVLAGAEFIEFILKNQDNLNAEVLVKLGHDLINANSDGKNVTKIVDIFLKGQNQTFNE